MPPSPNPETPAAPASSRPLLALAAIVGLGAVLGILLFSGLQPPRAAIADCRADAASITEVSGTLRIAGPDYYLVAGERWILLGHVCAGKTRMLCLAANNGAGQFMESHVGQAVQARVCPAGAVDFMIGGRQFFR